MLTIHIFTEALTANDTTRAIEIANTMTKEFKAVAREIWQINSRLLVATFSACPF